MRYIKNKVNRKINQIVIHCSASTFGDVEVIRRWHLKRGFKDIGYHYVILNGQITSKVCMPKRNGELQEGRPLNKIGAHVKGYNKGSIGICMIGTSDKIHKTPFSIFTIKQLRTLLHLLSELMEVYELTPSDVVGHTELESRDKERLWVKLCPCFEVSFIRSLLKYLPSSYLQKL